MVETETNSVVEQMNAAQRFEMPTAGLGSTVVWYRTGYPDDSKPQTGVVVAVNSKSLDIYIPVSRVRHDVVRHVDDPRLRISAEQRASGAWDHTLEYKNTLAWRQKIEENLDSLNRSKTAKTIDSLKSGSSEYQKVSRSTEIPKSSGLSTRSRRPARARRLATELGQHYNRSALSGRWSS
jgi:hypothetical protein